MGPASLHLTLHLPDEELMEPDSLGTRVYGECRKGIWIVRQ